MLKTNMLLFFLLLTAYNSHGFESQVVGQAADEVLTSRQVNAHFIFSQIYEGKKKLSYSLPLKEQALMSATSNVLMEFLIVKEADSFSYDSISKRALRREIEKFKNSLANKRKLKDHWDELDISEQELEKIAKKKMRSQRFLETKKETFNIELIEAEIDRALEEKEGLKREDVVEQIREQKKEEALREWFQILRSKYVVKNLLIQS